MGYCYVNLDLISNNVRQIRETVNELDRVILKSNMEVHALSVSWYGVDSSFFQSRWDEINQKGSVCSEYFRKLGNYYHYMCKLRTLYSEMQANAIRKSKGN